MNDSLATFREYMRLERQRTAGLSAEEYQRWSALRGRLHGALGGLDDPSAIERRATLRVPVSIKVRYENMGEMGDALMTNFSRGGLFLEIDPAPEIGTELKLRIEVVEPAKILVVTGQVASQNVGPRFETSRPGVGVRFKKLSASDQALVDALYEQHARVYLDARHR